MNFSQLGHRRLFFAINLQRHAFDIRRNLQSQKSGKESGQHEIAAREPNAGI